VVHATVAALKTLKSPEQIANKRSMQVDGLDYQRRGGSPTAVRRSPISQASTQGQPQQQRAGAPRGGQGEGGTP
jgi:small subunit ribosomal protein S5